MLRFIKEHLRDILLLTQWNSRLCSKRFLCMAMIKLAILWCGIRCAPICGNHLVLSGKPCWRTPSRSCRSLQRAKSNRFWRVVSDSNLVRYLRVNGEVSSERLMQKLSQAIDPGGLKLIPVQKCGADQRLDALSQESEGLPTLVLSPDGRSLLGILTPFDLL